MDMEKIAADAANYRTKFVVDKAVDSWREEHQAEAAAEEASKSVLDRISDTVSDVAEDVADSNIWGTARTVLSDVADAYNKAGEARMAFLHEGANLQDKARQGQVTNEDVETLRQSGRDASVAMTNIAASPFRQAARSFIQNNANNESSPFQSVAQSLQQTDVNLEYFMTPEEKLQKSREIEQALGLPAETTLSSNEAYKEALEMYNYKQKTDNIEDVWDKYPELQRIAGLDKEAAAIALHNMRDVKETHGVIDTFMSFLSQGNTELEYNNLQYKIMTGRATDEEVQRADQLKAQMEKDKREAPGFFQDPLGSMAAGVGGSLPEMGQSIAGAVAGVSATSAALTVAAVAGTIMSGGTSALAAAGITGMRTLIMRALASEAGKSLLKNVAMAGALQGMAAPESGARYAQNKAMTKQDGTPLYTDDEAKMWALLGGYTNAAIEVLPTMKVGAKALPATAKVFQQEVGTIVNQTMGRETLKDLGTAAMGNWLKLTATESAEEAVQSVADDVIGNAALASKGQDAAHYQKYGVGDILTRAGGAFVESLPGSMGFGLAGVGAGAVTGVGRLARSRKRMAEMENQYGKQQAQTMMGVMAVEQLQKAVENGNLHKVAPDVQKKVLHEQLAGTAFETAHIDVEMALQKENGREDLKKIAEAQGMSADDLETAISVNGYMTVDTETLAQAKASPDILDSVSFSTEAESMARMRENGKRILEDYQKNFDKLVQRQQNLIDMIAKEFLPEGTTDEQKDALRAVMMQNLSNPAQGWNELRKSYMDELYNRIGPALDALKKGMGNAGLMEVDDEQGNKKTIRYTENDEWYRNFYKTFKRQPTQAELEDMAIAMTIGDSAAPKVAGWIVDSAEAQEAFEQEKPIIDSLKHSIELLDSIKTEAKKLTGVEMELTEGMSPEAFKVYRALSSWTAKAGGKIGRSGRMSALLVARHADIFAEAVRKNTGKKDYTAEDYLRERLGFQLVQQGQEIKAGLNQSAGELAEAKLANDTKKWNILVGSYKHADKSKWRVNNARKLYDFMDVPLALQLVGVDYDKIKAYGSIFEHSMNPRAHKGMDEKVLKGLPQYMADPVMILKGSKPNSYLFVLEAKNKNDATIVAPVEISKEDEKYGVIDVLNSVYPKDGANGIPVFDGIAKSIENRDVLYINKNKADLMVEAYRRYLPSVLRLEMALSDFIVSDDYAKVKNENDLENAKKENPWMYQMAGIRARTAPVTELRRAQTMDGNSTPEEIYKETGWIKGHDGKWRFEIPDNLDKVNWNIFEEGNPDVNHRQLKYIYDNPKLYEAYPWLEDISVHLIDMNKNVHGGVRTDYTGLSIAINKQIGDEEKSGTLIHEIQHLIQKEENFAAGGSKETAYNQIIDQIRNLTKKIKAYKNGEHYAQALIDLNEMLFSEDKNEYAEKVVNKEIAELEKNIPEEAREKIWDLAIQKSYLQNELQNSREDVKLYEKLAGEQEARHATERAIAHTNVERAIKKLSKIEKRYEELKANPQDENFKAVETLYKWATDQLEYRKKETEKVPHPHDNNAIVVFDGQEYSAESTEILNQTAWHGTAHDFNVFDLGEIGTGEGAQAHGWGLYFAGNREVSEAYKNKLSGRSITIDGELYMTIPSVKPNQVRIGQNIVEDGGIYWAVNALEKNDSVEAAIAELKKKSQSKLKGLSRNAKAAIEFLQNKEINLNKGKLFEVEIPDNDVLLDEQKPFEEQPEKVQKALKKLVSESNTATKHPDFAEQIFESTGKKIYGIVSGLAEGDAPKNANFDNIRRLGSELLNKYGIKGITYEGGRDGRCFVVFDDKAISVIEKYNQQARESMKSQGGITINPGADGRRIISIMETADESTFMHEMAHAFLFDLEDLAQIDETSKKELEIVNQWATWEKGAAEEYKGTAWATEFADREQAIIDADAVGDYDRADKLKAEWRQERFARGFELYLKDGQAPARGLKAVFRKFKSFLVAIYKQFVGDGGKPTLPVKRVMDRMIASEDEIEAAALEDRYSDLTKAGGEKLLTETEEVTMKRWYEEERAAAKEKIMKLVMKDLEKDRQKEYENKLAEERERYEGQLKQEDVFVARRAVEYTKDKNIVTEWFNTVADFEAIDSITPALNTLVDEHMIEYSEKLDESLIDSHLSKDAIDKAMDSSKYRVKMENMITKGMERKKSLMNRINAKARAAMSSIEEKLNALPEEVDIQLEKHDNPTIKSIMKEINKLRFANKWDTADINHIEAMLRASTQADVRKALKEFKDKKYAEKKDLEDVESATKGMESMYKDLIKQTTESKPMTETCNVKYYMDKARNAGRRVNAMIKIKNWDMAVQQQRQKVFYSMMVKQARENKEARDRMVKDLSDKLNRKTVKLPKDERYWFNRILYLMKINKVDPKIPEGGVAKLDDIYKEQKETLDVLVGPGMLERIQNEGDNFGDYNKLSLSEFRSAYEDLVRLYTIGKDKFNFKSIAGRSIEEVALAIMTDGTANRNIMTLTRKIGPDQGGLNYIDAIGNLGQAGHTVARGIQMYQNSILKPENILELLGENAKKYIYGLLERAAEQEAKLMEKNLRTLQFICSVYSREERQSWSDQQYDFPGTKGWKITKENVFAMALNWGTETNRQRLIGGLIEDGRYKSEKSAQKVQGAIETLFRDVMTKKDWDFVQKLWDHIGSFWHDTAAVEEKLNGIALGRVENLPFEIETADGQTVKLKGGYMHIKYDFEKSSRAEEQEIEDMAMSITAGAKVFGMGRSMAKARSQSNIYRELDLHFSVVENHLQDVIHNICYRVPLRDIYRLLHYKNYSSGVNLEEYLRKGLGVDAYREIDAWTLDAWRQVGDNRNSAESSTNKFFRWVRSNSTMAIMGFKLKPVLDNLGNIPIAMNQVGSLKMLGALYKFYANGREENFREVNKLSAFMRTRAENLDRDLRQQPGVFRAGNRLMEFAREHAYDGLVWTDLAVSAPLWKQAYTDSFAKKIKEVQKENEENIKKRLELAAQADEIRAQIAALHNAAAGIDEHLRVRRYGTPAEIEALRETEYAGISDAELRAQWGEHKKEARELGKDLFKVEQEQEQANQLPVYTDDELLEEAKQRAVFAADKAVRDTFGSGRVIDQAAISRSKNELVRLFTAFYSFFNAQYNLIYMSYMKAKYQPNGTDNIARWAPLAKTVMFNVILSSLITSAVAFSLGLKGDDKDEKERAVITADGKREKQEIPISERFLKAWAKEALSVGTGGMYGVRDVTQLLGDLIFSGQNYGYKMGSVATRGFTEAGKAFVLVMKKGEKDAEIQAQQDKREREHQEKLKKYTGKKRREYLAKWEEEQKYRKPPKRITYSEILGHAAAGAATLTAARTGITTTMTNAITGTMQYMLDTDMRFDPTWKNIVWSAIFDKRPVEREIPKKPPVESKKKKKKQTVKS